MLITISYIFKAMFSILFSGICISLIEDEEQLVINYFIAPLICATVFHLCFLYSSDYNSIAMAILFLFLLQVNLWLTENYHPRNKMFMFVLTINGALIGMGYVFLSIVYVILFYLLFNYSGSLLSSFDTLSIDEFEIKNEKDDN